ncbi:hypothetical protein MCOR25_003043 [Pyricularia grisea]|uniref:Uncharacterized protein n=1 Tax=Pyricularia grisea TaxID=148305 RepID=A0A6P8BJ53_PYRGI|nr:uncharacterized protein PgNI_00590 [Pyricularia grisea]KAI6374780.1 hypothetical protein MCOR25_003043 [Pyricularia grisea]TLD16936.1 hypothetical protein PgNI_00590 [Pyricularia grisea]
MPLLDFPPGDNATDTIINGVHFNLTTLRNWNYQYYSNQTVSNGTWDWCMIMAEPWTPTRILANGTFMNSTWCYTPTHHIGPRAGVGMAFAAIFGIGIVLSLVNLDRHGRLHLPVEKRFYPVGRRWQWYFSIIACALALAGLISNVDVDRFFLPELPIVLVSFFWYLIQMAAIAIVWESVRHWGSWMERQFIDADPFSLPEDGRRYRFELLIPLVFYAFLFLNFFLIFPRNWGPLQLQRSPEQTRLEAIPAATELRLKLGSFALFFAWLVILVSLRHTINEYQPRNRGLLNRAIGIIKLTPLRLHLLIFLSLVVVAYQALVPWSWENSPMNIKGNVAAIYLGGFLPTLLIVYVNIVAGFMRPNEDQELIRQRRLRGAEHDAQLRITKKPTWWRRVRGDVPPPNETMRERLTRNAREVGGRGVDPVLEAELAAAGPTTDQTQPLNSSTGPNTVEMGAMQRPNSNGSSNGGDLPSPNPSRPRPDLEAYAGKSDRRRNERTMAAVAGMLFPASGNSSDYAQRRAELMTDGPPPPPYRDNGDSRRQPSERSNSTASMARPAQQPKSMLDV